MSDIKGINVLVSGGAGFVGSFLVKRLVAEGAKVSVLAKNLLSLGRLREVSEAITVYQGDVSRQHEIHSCLKEVRPEVIFHLAGARNMANGLSSLTENLEANFMGMLNFFRALDSLGLSMRCFVHTGSLSEYGVASVPYNESQREEPVSSYSASKLAATHFCQMLHKSTGFPVVVLRPCLMYGPGQSTDMFIPQLIQACLRGQDYPMTSGQQARDFGYVEDIVDAYIWAAKTPKAIGHVINLGSGKEYSIRELANKIVELTGSATKLRFGEVPSRVAEIEHMACDTRKAKELLGWEMKTDLTEGLRKTIEWYRTEMAKMLDKSLT